MTEQRATTTKIACMVSVPKCASHSIREILELGENRDDDSEVKTEGHVIYENHQRLSVLEQKYDLAGKYVFAFVRNPYDRLSSWFRFHADMEPYASCTFAQWVERDCPTHWTIQNETNWQAEKLTPLLQHNFLAAEKFRPDFIGRIESFETDLQRIIADLNAICASAGIERRFEYRPLRMNRSRTSADDYSVGMKAAVYRQFRTDFEAYGYEA